MLKKLIFSFLIVVLLAGTIGTSTTLAGGEKPTPTPTEEVVTPTPEPIITATRTPTPEPIKKGGYFIPANGKWTGGYFEWLDECQKIISVWRFKEGREIKKSGYTKTVYFVQGKTAEKNVCTGDARTYRWQHRYMTFRYPDGTIKLSRATDHGWIVVNGVKYQYKYTIVYVNGEYKVIDFTWILPK